MIGHVLACIIVPLESSSLMNFGSLSSEPKILIDDFTTETFLRHSISLWVSLAHSSPWSPRFSCRRTKSVILSARTTRAGTTSSACPSFGSRLACLASCSWCAWTRLNSTSQRMMKTMRLSRSIPSTKPPTAISKPTVSSASLKSPATTRLLRSHSRTQCG